MPTVRKFISLDESKVILVQVIFFSIKMCVSYRKLTPIKNEWRR